MDVRPYIRIARVDHWFKNVFVLPGVVFAIYDTPTLLARSLVPRTLVALLATGLVASSNYTLNELLDAPMDAPVDTTWPEEIPIRRHPRVSRYIHKD